MKAVVITEFGAPSVLKIEERAIPNIADNEVLIKVKAAGINRLDVAQRKGNYPVPEGVVADILGLEVAGTIEKIGANVTEWKVGDDVFALISGGGYAEYVNAPASICIRKPENLSYIEAASLPETVYTVWSNVFDRCRFQSGETFMVHGGTSGIGITAIQLAKLFGAKKIYTTVGSDDKKAFCESLGATAINYKTDDFADHVKDVDVILDIIGGDYFGKNINALNTDGRLVYINAAKGFKVECNLLKIMTKRLTLTGSTLRSRELPFKEALTQALKEKFLPLVENGSFKPVIHATFPLHEADQAHELMESSTHIGKIMLKLD